MARRLGSYAPLSATYAADDAMIEAGEAAELLYVRGLAFCASSDSDGYLSDAQLVRYVGVGMRDAPKRAERLVEVGLWERQPGGYVVRAWLKWNKPVEDREGVKRRDRERKARRNPAPSPDSDVDGFQPDSTRKPSGSRAEAERNADGVPPDSLHAPAYAPAQAAALAGQSNPIHSTVPPSAGDAAAPPNGETLNRRANRLAKTYTDRRKLSNFPAVAGLLRKAITAGYDDDTITDGLSRLAEDNRPVTADTLRIEIDGLPPRRGRRPDDEPPRPMYTIADLERDRAERDAYERDHPPGDAWDPA